MTRPTQPQRCNGTFGRRSFVRAGLAGLGGLGLTDLLRLESQASTRNAVKGKSLLVLWLWGGPSHMDTFDMKPDSPSEFRGEFRPIRTNVPGIEICEHLPRMAKLADQFSIIRSLSHHSPGHVNSTHTVLTGYPGELVETPPYHPKHPDVWAVVQKELGPREQSMPAHIALPNLRYGGSAYLGGGLDPFLVAADPNTQKFRVPNLSLQAGDRPLFTERVDLLHRFDGFRRDVDQSGAVRSMDDFESKALSILTSDKAREAFDLSKEHPRIRDRYGRHAVGQRLLLGRRLVEAGARIVNVDFPCVPGQKAFSWDDHASVWNIFEQMKIRLPVLDQVVSALLEDLRERGLSEDVLVAVMGEMSHTPRINYYHGQPGREHWGQTMSVLLAGGGLRMGQIVGSTNRTGDEPKEHPLHPADLLATWYQCLGVPLDRQYTDHFGRPIPLLPPGGPIQELIATA